MSVQQEFHCSKECCRCTPTCYTLHPMTQAMSRSGPQPITEQMQALIDKWENVGDVRAVFLRCYRVMTTNVLAALETGEFLDPVWVHDLLHRFAEYYFEALEAYERQVKETPNVWQVAFAGADDHDREAVQHLLLGVNAHINYDLVWTLVDMLLPEWESLSPEKRARRYTDHRHVNVIIGRSIDVVQDEIVEQASPGMALIDTTLGPVDEWLTSRLIAHWREEVWQNALRCLEAPDDRQKEALRCEIEAATLNRANAILLQKNLLVLRHLV